MQLEWQDTEEGIINCGNQQDDVIKGRMVLENMTWESLSEEVTFNED